MSEFTYKGQVFHMHSCAACKTLHAFSDPIYRAMMERVGEMAVHCPNGHQWVFAKGETDLDKMRRERDRLAQAIAQRDDEITRQRDLRKHAERSAIAYKGKVTRLKNRASVGLCPCCNRSFQDLARHMAGKHPEFVIADHSQEES